MKKQNDKKFTQKEDNESNVIVKKLEKRLGFILSPIIGPLQDWCEDNFISFTEDFIDEADTISKSDFVHPKTDISVPILEKARYTSEEKVRGVYAKLLARACSNKYRNQVLKSYISVIDSMDEKDVILLEKFRKGIVYDKINTEDGSVEQSYLFSLLHTDVIPFLLIGDDFYFGDLKNNFPEFTQEELNIHLNNLIDFRFITYNEILSLTNAEERKFYYTLRKEAQQKYKNLKRSSRQEKFIRFSSFSSRFLKLIYPDDKIDDANL